MGAVICMASSKGGSGKTVLSATFAALLADVGRRVLLVDTDAATNGLSLLYLDEVLAASARARADGRPPIIGTYELPLARDVPYGFVDLPTGAHLLPATVAFFNTEQVSSGDQRERLRIGIEEWRESFDYIILDAQAGSDVYAAISMELADRVVIVSEYDPLSAAGVERLKALFPTELTYERAWVLLSKMLPDLVKGYSDFMEVARYLPPIPWDPDVVRAYSRRSLALDLERGNEHTLAVLGTLRALLTKAEAAVLDGWVTRRAVHIRTPVEVQADDLRRELAGLARLELERTQALARSRMWSALTLVVAMLVAAAGVTLSGFVGLISIIALIVLLAGVAWSGRLTLMLGARNALRLAAGLEPTDWGEGEIRSVVERQHKLRADLSKLEAIVALDDKELLLSPGRFETSSDA